MTTPQPSSSKPRTSKKTGSFKIRGALSKMTAPAPGSTLTSISPPASSSTTTTTTAAVIPKPQRLITASSGNHGIGSTLAASILGKHLTVVLPETVIPSKLAKIKSFNIDVILHGTDPGLAEQHAQTLAASGEYTYISPYNDLDVIAGHGTIGLEILEQCAAYTHGGQVDNVFVSMGGGGLIAGVGAVMKAFSPQTKVWGVAARNSMALAESMEVGRVVGTVHLETLADGVAGSMDGDSVTLVLARDVVDRVVVCGEELIKDGVREFAWGEGMLVEGAAGLALAGYRKVVEEVRGETSVVVVCGGNFERGVVEGVVCGR